MPKGNIGDDINEVIWPHYVGNHCSDTDNLIIGIGTLLNHHIPESNKYTVISSGIGYGTLPKTNENWTFLAVRGEYSRKAFNLSDDVLLLDGAYLLKDCYEKPDVKISHEVGYIPHVGSIEYGNWEKVCDLAGIKFIDPRLGLEEFLRDLLCCRKVLAEAMHGAIIADCYGVPWQPVKAYHHINTHKWDDWLSAFGQTAKFSVVNSVWYDIKLPKNRILKNTIKKLIFAIYPKFNITPPIYPESKNSDYSKAADQLKNLANKEFFMNDRNLVDTKIDSLKLKLKKHFK